MIKDKSIKKLENLINKGHFKEALDIIHEFELNDNLSIDAQLSYLILRITIFNKLGKFEEALKQGQNVLKKARAFGRPTYEVDALLQITDVMIHLGLFKKSNEMLEIVEKKIILNREISDISSKDIQSARLANVKGELSIAQGELNQAFDYFKNSLTFYEKLEDEIKIAELHNNIGVYHLEKGELDQSLKCFNKSYSISKQYEIKDLMAGSLGHIGIIYANKGDLDRALKNFQETLKIFKELGNKQHFAAFLHNLGSIFWRKRDLNKSLEIFQESLKIFKEVGNKFFISVSLGKIGEIYWQKGNLETAIEYLNESRELALGNNQYLSKIIFSLILIYLESDYVEKAKVLFQELKIITEKEKNMVIYQRFQVAEAIILKTSTRARYRGKAEEILERLVEKEIIDHEITIIALLNLCDVLLIELRETRDASVLKDLNTLIERLSKIAQQKKLHWLLAEVFVLQSRLCLVELDLNQSRHLLTQAQLIADKHGLTLLAQRISQEHDTFLRQLSQWEALIQQNISFDERLEKAELETFVLRMIRQGGEIKLDDVQNEKPVLFLIVAPTGYTMYSTVFVPEIQTNMQLLAGFLTAINAFSREVFAVSGFIERIKHQDYTLLIKAVDPVLICYAFKGQSYSAQQKIDQFIQILENSYWPIVIQAVKGCETIYGENKILLDEVIKENFT